LKLSFFPGCSFCGTAKEYGESTLAVMAVLGHELVEIPDWNCCGATSAHALDENLQYLLPLRNLVLAEGMGLEAATSSCSACYNVSKQTERHVLAGGKAAQQLNREIEATMGRPYEGKVRFLHPLSLMSRPEELKKIRERIVRPLKGLQVVMYYGCYLSRPPEIVAFESPEQPVSMDEICAAVGAEVKRWSWKVDCCGASLTMPRASIVQDIVDRLMAEAVHAGADAVVTPCPMCLANLDSRQDARRSRGEKPVPIFYFTELMAMAFGLPGLRRWLRKRLTDPMPLLRELGPADAIVRGRAGPARPPAKAASAGASRGG
jgi:heterodisulfide reductase subunit B